jgi:hypothetical protein
VVYSDHERRELMEWKTPDELVTLLKYLACSNCGHAVGIPDEIIDELRYLVNYERTSAKNDTAKARKARATMRPAPAPGVMT